MENKTNKTKIPETLFQYRPPELWALENLSRQVIHFTSPEKFSDPYDCNIPPIAGGLEDTEFAYLSQNWPVVRGMHGIACFSECNDNMLMWSHYGGRGMGFCLEFEIYDMNGIAAFGDDEVMPVEYEEPISSVADIEKWQAEDGRWQQFFLYKSKDWAYEKEWRIIGPKDTEMVYLGQWLKAVYFGTRATEGTKKIIRSIVGNAYGDDVVFFEGQPSKTEYKVDFEEMC